ncbi:MAG: hypothetical protein IJ192_09475 [Clostridia bacterium]|nr:hypothetical protein [Clostridia bacterium]
MKVRLISILVSMMLLVLTSCETKNNTQDNTETSGDSSVSSEVSENQSSNIPSVDSQVSENINHHLIQINEEEFSVTYENNDTADAFQSILPVSFDMQELNGNEKYIYLDSPLPSAPQNVGEIHAGDIMLYGDNCIVVFYESFSTPYSYTKIGHIENAQNLKSAVGNGNINISFQ